MTAIHTLSDADGLAVRGHLIEADGRLYGLAGEGGPHGTTACSSTAKWDTIEHARRCPGSLFSVRLDGTGFRVEYAFSWLDNHDQNIDGYHPYGSPVLAPDGWIYLSTQAGGIPTAGWPSERIPGVGVLARYHPRTGNYETLHSFSTEPAASDGAYPMGELAVTPDGRVCGTAKGNDPRMLSTVWCWSPRGFASAAIPAAAGIAYGGLTYMAGRLHGITEFSAPAYRGPGTYYTVDPATLQVTIVDEFPAFAMPALGDDNTSLQAPTAMDDNTLMIARQFGGTHGTGLVARLSSAGIEVIKAFDDISLEASPRFSNATGAIANGRLASALGMVYGATMFGGANGAGGVYRVAPDGGRYEWLHSFGLGADQDPVPSRSYGGPILASNGALYLVSFEAGAILRFDAFACADSE